MLTFVDEQAKLALSRISPRVRVRVSVSIVYRIAPGGYSIHYTNTNPNTVTVVNATRD